ncbi:MAG: GNAT family protein [Pseudoruegeria sp.]
MQQWPENVVLTGEHVVLVPLDPSHCSDLQEAAADGELHRLWYTSVPAPEGVSVEIERRLSLRAAGSMLPFAILRKADMKPVGMTTYMQIDAATKRVEIGSTWYRKAVQRGPINTECKYLMLRHAFEQLDCVAVEFRTHFINHQSRRAIERLGAKLDGVLRSHIRLSNGTLRDTAVYSIIQGEWPTVKSHLIWQMERPRDE